jgi:DNA-binding HxlR family transcriptional regulator
MEGSACVRLQRIGAVLGKRWNIEIIDVLTRSELRFCELRRALTRIDSNKGVSDRVLSERLRELTDCGFVQKCDGVYELTEIGSRMAQPLDLLREIADDLAPAAH